ncbi:hypothetical protein H0H81_003935 [Sphagnurus paluster]|uniref:Uncharacterized protein n=1 Tax=Sphagnurus paluster TaxID=117069 RepID=A0A9P7KHJ1_9AGAR|nr:hypothetical protein H0H81_003935 [Sphagnurus paluster]
MAPSTLVLGSITNQDSLKTCSPYLMPFHIDYSGEAPISTYLRVSAAKETVGAPPAHKNASDNNEESLATASGQAGSSQIAEGNGQEEKAPSDAEVDKKPVTTAASLAKRVTETTTRFIATFRGRTIQGLKVELPTGYIGVVLRAGKEAEMDKAREKKTATRDKAAANRKGNASSKKGRFTRSKARVEEDEELEEDHAMDVDVEISLDTEAHQLLMNDDAIRTLSISSQFSSFVLWHADHPVDEGRDDYVRSLTEWTQLARVIHRTED